jgi:transketolase
MKSNLEYLENKAYEIRRLSLISTTQAGSGHPTSCLSAADILAVLFFDIMREDDHFILSKGHAAPALYAVYHLLGCITEKELLTLRQFKSPLEGHPTPRFPYVSVATGSLGQGLSVSVGQQLAEKFNRSNKRNFVLMGDSETTEGSVWEAAELASYYKLNNLVAIIDVNGLGQTTRTIDSLETYRKKFEAFGWHAIITEGNNITELKKVFENLDYNAPTCIIAHTLKGYGVPSVQDKNGWHGKVFTPEELPKILAELDLFQPTLTASADKRNARGETAHPEPVEGSAVFCKKITHKTPEKITFKEPSFKIGEKLATRKALGQALEYLGSLENKVVVLDAEVNNSTYTDIFAKKYPERFFQAFIAEQNMIGMAAGLASQGFITFSATFSAFFTRAYDQLRMAAISRLPLRIIGSHCGVSVGQDGPSQMGLEDIALFRTLPDSIVLYPCDAVSAYRCIELMANYHAGISYVRTTRADTPIIYDNTMHCKLGGCHILKQTAQDTVTIIAAGITVFEALKAHAQLLEEKISVTVIDCYSIKPLPINDIIAAAEKTNYRIIIVEDHYAAGGLGEAIIAALAEHTPEKPWNIKHLAVTKLPMSGKPEELLHYEDIDSQAIYKAAKNFK